MTEEFLWHTWKFRLFDHTRLCTTAGEKISIARPGDHNFDSGPDFFNARLKIGNTEWAGNVEIHVRSSDWKRHAHHTDKAYDNVILHVVYEADVKLRRKNGELIPTLELRERIPANVYGKYLQFRSSKDWIPCGKQAAAVDTFILSGWLDRLLVERLERKSGEIKDALKLNRHNWEETFYQVMARSFGFNTNSGPFGLLAKSLRYSFLGKHKDNQLQLEAMLWQRYTKWA